MENIVIWAQITFLGVGIARAGNNVALQMVAAAVWEAMIARGAVPS
jgi:hypothetical protein